MDTATFNTFLVVMAVTALIVFIALHFINAGYGMLFDKKWGASLSNRIGWIVMEAPVFIAMISYGFSPPTNTGSTRFESHSSSCFKFIISNALSYSPFSLKGIAACHSIS